MWVGVITLFPGMFQALTGYGITGRAVQKGLLELSLWNPRDFTCDRHRRVDDRPYGGGPGMVMQVEPLLKAIRAAQAASGGKARVIHLSPQGRRLDQARVQALAREARLILVAGRYEGIDERLIELAVDEEISIGDYVLSGGELAAMVCIDAITRLLPGALGDEASAAEDSFARGLLDHPHYTRPEVVEGLRVPEVLLSGDHKAIARWRLKEALGRTWMRRPDLLSGRALDEEQRELLATYLSEQGVKERSEQ